MYIINFYINKFYFCILQSNIHYRKYRYIKKKKLRSTSTSHSPRDNECYTFLGIFVQSLLCILRYMPRRYRDISIWYTHMHTHTHMHMHTCAHAHMSIYLSQVHDLSSFFLSAIRVKHMESTGVQHIPYILVIAITIHKICRT